jgi:hypothetical protein
MAALSYRTQVSALTSHGSCGAQVSDKRYAVCVEMNAEREVAIIFFKDFIFYQVTVL